MSTTLLPALITRLEKVAVDNGFDLSLPRQRDWLGFASSQAPLHLWLTAHPVSHFLAAVSQRNVALAVHDFGIEVKTDLPLGAFAARGVEDIPALHRLVRRAFQLSKSLPDELLHTFENAAASLPRTTEAERLVVARVGQDIFRAGLLDYWERRCAITGLAIVELLRASHIKPWADCPSDAERLDVFNGLLLAPHLDAAFDRGYITVADDGSVVVSSAVGDEDRRILGLDHPLTVRGLAAGHRAYLPWHRECVFNRSR